LGIPIFSPLLPSNVLCILCFYFIFNIKESYVYRLRLRCRHRGESNRLTGDAFIDLLVNSMIPLHFNVKILTLTNGGMMKSAFLHPTRIVGDIIIRVCHQSATGHNERSDVNCEGVCKCCKRRSVLVQRGRRVYSKLL
jgi:hypothetical protein